MAIYMYVGIYHESYREHTRLREMCMFIKAGYPTIELGLYKITSKRNRLGKYTNVVQFCVLLLKTRLKNEQNKLQRVLESKYMFLMQQYM